MARIHFMAIVPDFEKGKKIDIEARVMAVLSQQTNAFEKQYKKVSDKFQNHTVRYRKDVGTGVPPNGGDQRHFGVTATDTDVMVWLDQGTTVRWRVMSHDWRSLTKPGGGLSTQVPRGRAMGIPKTPKPGIKPREFSADVVAREEAKFYTKIETVFRVQAQSIAGQSRIVNP